MLAGQALKVGSARTLYGRDQASADQLLAQLENDIESTLDEVRRLARGLRPPALDQLGLVQALREVARRYQPRVRISLEVAGDLDHLPAGIEVAVYRIVDEALTNVVRHAAAECCQVRLVRHTACVELDILDDGDGLPARIQTGVGLTSMRERAEELGGSLSIAPNIPTGTKVRAELPLSRSTT